MLRRWLSGHNENSETLRDFLCFGFRPQVRLICVKCFHPEEDPRPMAPKAPSNTIALNKRARFEYHLHDEFEAGIQLAGWEVKALRAGRVQLTESFVTMHRGEAYLHGCNINPLISASTHVVAEPKRARKLLLHRKELARLVGGINQKGYTCAALSLYWRGPWVKCKIALASGKKAHDKRASIKDREWSRDKERLMKDHR